MNKQDLVNFIAKKTVLKKGEIERVLNAALGGISGALKKGQKVTFVGFGSFSLQSRKAREGRNPRTGASIKIPATKVVKFRPGKNLKSL